MFWVFLLLFALSLIVLIISLIKPELILRDAVASIGKSKVRKRSMLVFSTITIVFFILSLITVPELTPEQKAAMAQKKEKARIAAEAKKAAQEAKKTEEAKQELPQKKDVSAQTKAFIKDDLNRLTRYVSSNADTTWQNNFIEPAERLTQGESPEYFLNNIEVGAFVYKGVIKEIEDFEIPSYLSDEDAKLVKTITDGLHQSINKRVEVMELIIEAMEPVRSAKNADETIMIMNKVTELVESDEVTNRMLESNSSLVGSVQSYGKLLKKYEE